MAVRTTTLHTQPQLRWWIALADRVAALRSSARAVRPETREPLRAYVQGRPELLVSVALAAGEQLREIARVVHGFVAVAVVHEQMDLLGRLLHPLDLR